MLSRILTTKEQLLLLFLGTAVCVGGLAYFFAASPATPQTLETTSALAPWSNVSAEAKDATLPVAPDEPVAPTPVETIDVDPTNAILISPDDEVALITVSVRGAVKVADVFKLSSGARVDDALRAAGGALPDADLSDINLAATLIDGSTLTVPARAAGLIDGDKLVVRGTTNAVNPAQYTISGWRPGTAATPGNPPAASGGGATTNAPTNGLINLNTATAEMLETLPGIGEKRAQDIIRYREAQLFQRVEDLENVHGIGPKTMEGLRPLVTVGR